MGKDANLKAKNVRADGVFVRKDAVGGLIVGVVGAHWTVHGDLLEKVADNLEKVGVFPSDAPLFTAALRVGFAMDG